MRLKLTMDFEDEDEPSRIEFETKDNAKANIVCSSLHTKEWRKTNISRSVGQKDSNCERYQRMNIETITGTKCLIIKGTRINQRTLEMRHKYNNCMSSKGNIIPDGFDWTEDFDGYQKLNGFNAYYNFKFVSGKGGSQTRTLREVYHFIETQLRYLLKCDINSQVVFFNILDGDHSHFKQEHFKYLLSSHEYDSVRHRCFVGDSKQFSVYYNNEVIIN